MVLLAVELLKIFPLNPLIHLLYNCDSPLSVLKMFLVFGGHFLFLKNALLGRQKEDIFVEIHSY